MLLHQSELCSAGFKQQRKTPSKETQKANQKTADTISRSLTNAWGRDPNSVLHVRIPRDIHIVTFGLNVCVPSLPARQNEKKTKQARFRQA